MNRWYEPQHSEQAVATFRLIFPPWGIGLNAEQRETARATWNKNDILIEGDGEALTVVSFIILDANVTLRKKEGSPPSALIGTLTLRPGKKLCMIASQGPEGDLKAKAQDSLKKIDMRGILPESHSGKELACCLTGYNAPNSVDMVVFPVVYSPQ